MTNRVGRRTFIKSVAGATSGALVSSLAQTAASAEEPLPASDPSQVIILASSSIANVETTSGNIRGYIRNNIFTFKGIPYAASPAGDRRFLPPAKPNPWTGVRTTLQFGCVCPQPKRDNWQYDELAFLCDWDDGHPGEDCLLLNVWTPNLNDGRKRPVMVWLHGGAYIVGSGNQLKSYDGENLSRRGDVVVITINHRLGILGYLDLSGLGEDRFADTANVAMLDIVAALEWVRDNIANFGGDPGNVTVFGQSAGAGEISALMVMPAAAGLFHRAIVQSFSALKQNTKEQAMHLRDAVLKELGPSRSDLRAIQKIPVEHIVAAGVAVRQQLGALPPRDRAGWGPWVDGKVIPGNSFDPTAPWISAKVPMLIGTTLNENSPIGNPDAEALYADVEKKAAGWFGGKAPAIIEMARRFHPRATSVEISTLIEPGGVEFVMNAIKQAQRKSALGTARVFMYLFAWHTPVLDGRPLAFHQAEIPFVFDNTDRCASVTGGGPEPRALAANISQAWINFARSGNPNHSGLPDWPAFTIDNGTTMVFDSVCQPQSYPDRPLHELNVAALSR